ncbi:hypothetical protein RT717_20015 [Imperialibacter roseus]|uniref:Polysaccharide (De)acetylase n=1 Tax=Imperialibacter roseus TaxID=1324217 RepID=A0ABZ0IK18_9BACT|nr:hypothetical protein [Imperialibacter roseus]WOK05370.1 hypothetical protein RT717_20015 [Imperialibacter roseus]
MLQELKTSLQKNLSNLPGWRTRRKIVVIESDDWGAIRMASGSAYRSLQNAGVLPFDSDEERYLSNDALASGDDLEALFDVLDNVKDCNRRSAVFTAVSLVANPDFQKIKESGYQTYFYEPFTETLKKYPNHSNSFSLWQQGIQSGVFIPEFHGREHLNVSSWLRALRAGNEDTLTAFEHGVYGITPRNPINHVSYQAAFDIDDLAEINYLKSVLEEGLTLFQQLHGYSASFFVPTNGPFNNGLEECLDGNGIKYIGASKIQLEPIGGGQFRRRFHYPGQKNHLGQVYTGRNCVFESSSQLKSDWVDSCLKEIEIAFTWRKPAVVSTHRVNYIGWLNPKNRDKGLKELSRLLTTITSKWPDVEFMTSVELGALIMNNK